MGYWNSQRDANFPILFCPLEFTQGGNRILKMANPSSAQAALIPNVEIRLFDLVREVMCFHHYAEDSKVLGARQVHLLVSEPIYLMESAGTILMLSTPMRVSGRSGGCVLVVAILS